RRRGGAGRGAPAHRRLPGRVRRRERARGGLGPGLLARWTEGSAVRALVRALEGADPIPAAAGVTPEADAGAERPTVMQMIDTLVAGGAERVAVNLANLLPRDRYRAALCTTRRDGVLGGLVAGHVARLSLGRRWRLSPTALAHLSAFNRAHEVE